MPPPPPKKKPGSTYLHSFGEKNQPTNTQSHWTRQHTVSHTEGDGKRNSAHATALLSKHL